MTSCAEFKQIEQCGISGGCNLNSFSFLLLYLKMAAGMTGCMPGKVSSLVGPPSMLVTSPRQCG